MYNIYIYIYIIHWCHLSQLLFHGGVGLTVIAAAQVNTITVTEAQSAGKSVDPDTMGRFHQSLLGALEHEWNIAGIIFPLLVFFFFFN